MTQIVKQKLYLLNHYLNKFGEYFLYFFTNILVIFLLFVFTLNSYLFCGDTSHGKGSYLLVMHSTLAITAKLLWYLFICIVIILYYMYTNNTKHYTNLLLGMYMYIYMAQFGLVHSILFIVTGMIWGDYSWGFSVTIEYRFITLTATIAMYLYSAFLYTVLQKASSTLYVYMTVFKILLVLVLCIISFDYFIKVLNIYVYQETSFRRYELHQSDESLHFFLISVSGYYISLIIIYVFYFICVLSYSILYANTIHTYNIDMYITLFYSKNISSGRANILYSQTVYQI